MAKIHVALNALDFWAFFALMGLLISRAWLLPKDVFEAPEFQRRWQQLLGLSLLVLTLTGFALFVVRTMEMARQPLVQVLGNISIVLVQTHFGQIWLLHLALLTALWAGWARARLRLSTRWVGFMLVLAAGFAFTYSASSHASDKGDFTPEELNDCAHLLAASVWGGGIFAASLLLFPAFLREPQRRRLLIAVMVNRLSAISAIALAFVLATGVYNAKLRVGSIDALFTTAYGQTLVAKLLCVALLVLIGAINRFVLQPEIKRWSVKSGRESDKPVRQIRATVSIDAILVSLILIAAAVLIQSTPPSAMKGMPAMPGMSH